ncbi:hypothetical protein GGTG_06980 [Gaeumannomyces tritici R3-111a-1]|uniref:Uncharacterized protein n=1 Tax=Gaeumannomyces tritici (strain R3-111a-1) TaxID=644352 RepID=J3P0D3_GAET3|nr:hypothetical protein GGTG_06980 [Gaeumannomyces tritici R3-111a-1]EJT77066.1 hypothetical protein GGTG_06980 [Gaeumannomyces tritici R3-111a-1]
MAVFETEQSRIVAAINTAPTVHSLYTGYKAIFVTCQNLSSSMFWVLLDLQQQQQQQQPSRIPAWATQRNEAPSPPPPPPPPSQRPPWRTTTSSALLFASMEPVTPPDQIIPAEPGSPPPAPPPPPPPPAAAALRYGDDGGDLRGEAFRSMRDELAGVSSDLDDLALLLASSTPDAARDFDLDLERLAADVRDYLAEARERCGRWVDRLQMWQQHQQYQQHRQQQQYQQYPYYPQYPMYPMYPQRQQYPQLQQQQQQQTQLSSPSLDVPISSSSSSGSSSSGSEEMYPFPALGGYMFGPPVRPEPRRWEPPPLRPVWGRPPTPGPGRGLEAAAAAAARAMRRGSMRHPSPVLPAWRPTPYPYPEPAAFDDGSYPLPAPVLDRRPSPHPRPSDNDGDDDDWAERACARRRGDLRPYQAHSHACRLRREGDQPPLHNLTCCGFMCRPCRDRFRAMSWPSLLPRGAQGPAPEPMTGDPPAGADDIPRLPQTRAQ